MSSSRIRPRTLRRRLDVAAVLVMMPVALLHSLLAGCCCLSVASFSTEVPRRRTSSTTSRSQRRRAAPSLRAANLSSAPPSGAQPNGDDGGGGGGDGESAKNRRRMQSLARGNHPLISLNLNLDSMAQAGAGNRAQELLQRIQALYSEGYYEVSPDIVSYNSVLKAWKEGENSEKAWELLQEMMTGSESAPSSSLSSPPPPSWFPATTKASPPVTVDVISFNTVLAAFAKEGNYPKALDLLRKMEQNPAYPKPDVITYNIVLYSLAQSPDVGTAARAENLLREVMSNRQQPQKAAAAEGGRAADDPPAPAQPNSQQTTSVKVDTTSFNTVLLAWSKLAAATEDGTAVGAAQRADDLLSIMEGLAEAGHANVRPDVYSYTTVIQAWARCATAMARHPQHAGHNDGGGSNNNRDANKQSFHAADKARQVFDRMTRQSHPTSSSSSSDRALQPNRITYTALMSALAKAGRPDSAESILNHMVRAYQEGGSVDLQPDTASFSAIVDGWARVSCPERPEAATRALQILKRMKGLGGEGGNNGVGRPNAQTYTSVLTALAKSGTPSSCDAAHLLLREMEEEYVATPSLRPTYIHYNCVLNGYAKSPRPNKAVLAQRLLQEMLLHPRSDCRPDTTTYNTVLAACANSPRAWQDQSFAIALAAFKAVVKNKREGDEGMRQASEGTILSIPLEPTSTTFAQFAKASRRLLKPPQQHSVLTKTLRLCRELGLLHRLVVQQGQLACQDEDEWKAVAGELSDYVSRSDDFDKRKHTVPNKWTSKSRR